MARATAARLLAAASGQQRRVLGRVVVSSGGAGGLSAVEVVVIQALRDEDAVGDAKVAGESNGGRGEVGEKCACCRAKLA